MHYQPAELGNNPPSSIYARILPIADAKFYNPEYMKKHFSYSQQINQSVPNISREINGPDMDELLDRLHYLERAVQDKQSSTKEDTTKIENVTS